MPEAQAVPLHSAPTSVIKRDSTTQQPFDMTKVETAIRKAWAETGPVDEPALRKVVAWVVRSLEGEAVDVESIQDAVEIGLMRSKFPAVAKRFILYRQERKLLREQRLHPDPDAVANYIHPAKYARYLPMELRRELYSETVERVEAMHLRRFQPLFERDPELEREIRWAFELVQAKRVLPSMRLLQFAGAATESANPRAYNCCSSYIDRPRVFAEILYLLLCGCGVGYSIQTHHVEKLPSLRQPELAHVVHHVVGDTIEGWANALEALVDSYINGYFVEFSYHLIRSAGSPLKTSGGKAPGHLFFKATLEAIRGVLSGAAGRKLRPIECHDIICIAADAVLSGGIRRSALLALFSEDDVEMLHAKTGNWYTTAPWRANANNSVLLLRKEATKRQFKGIIKATQQWGEPGFVFSHSTEYVPNPCAEINMYPVDLATGTSGFSFCNLVEINASLLENEAEFEEVAKAATLLGTLQASYTSFDYLGAATEAITRRDALLGVSMTGMMDSPELVLNASVQKRIAGKTVEWNRDYAARLGIQSAARVTTVKPSGSTSLALGCVGSGHHAHHARRYIRRVTANEKENVFQFFKKHNPHMCVRKPNGDWVIEFPVEAPAGAVLKEDLTALQFLAMVRSTQLNWVKTGTAKPELAPGLHHNVSNTVQVGPDEWEAVADYIWEHREDFTGVSLLAKTGDKDYQFAPFESISTPADEIRWNNLLANYVPVDYSQMMEMEDGTALTQEASCAGAGCEK